MTPSKPPTGNPSSVPRPLSNIGLNTPITPANLNANRPTAVSRPPVNLPPQFQPQPKQQPKQQPQPKPQLPKPPQPPPPEKEDKHVSFTEPQASQDEYDFGSDDAFFAAVDLESLGDVGIGGHIDFDEGTGGVSVVEEEISMDVDNSTSRQSSSRNGGAQHEQSNGSMQPPSPQRHVPQQQQQQKQHQQQRPPQVKPAPGRSRQEILEEYERERLAKEREKEREQRQSSNQARANVTTASGTTSSNAVASSPPMGGFRFPTIVNNNQSGRPMGPGQGSARPLNFNFNSNSSSGIGLKRTFDAAQ